MRIRPARRPDPPLLQNIERAAGEPFRARHGILIGHLAQWATDRKLRALTLTTYTEVPRNAPYYARLGFRRLAEDERSDELRSIRAEEAEHGVDRWPRVCMRREL